MSSIQRSGWIVDSVIDHNINISKYSPLAGSSYIKSPNELDHARKDLINTAGHNPARATKSDKGFAKELDFKDIKFPVKTRDIHKIEKKEFYWH